MKLITKVRKLKQFKDDPIGYLVDKLIEVIVNLFIPIPWAGKVISESRGFVLGCLGSLIILGVFLITVVGAIFMSPMIVSSSFLQQITALLNPPINVSLNQEFISTAIPRQNPLGGSGTSLSTVTAYFLDTDYYLQFGRNHTGIDFVPNAEYFKSSKSYQETKQVVVYSTINGKVRSFTDQYGGETVEVVNDDSTLKTVFIHFSKILVDTGQTIQAGTPIGIMGKTGLATGNHVHYEVRINNSSGWAAIDPLQYIK